MWKKPSDGEKKEFVEEPKNTRGRTGVNFATPNETKQNATNKSYWTTRQNKERKKHTKAHKNGKQQSQKAWTPKTQKKGSEASKMRIQMKASPSVYLG